MVPIKQKLVSPLKTSIKCPYKMDWQTITVHNTYNDAPAVNEISYMINNDKTISFHFAVDDKEIVQGIQEDRNAFHCGNTEGNKTSLAVEICYSKSGGERFLQAERNAAEFIASKLKEKGLGVDRLRTHKSWSGKNCPHRTLELGWERFVAMVDGYLNPPVVNVESRPMPTLKSLDDVAREVIQGKWGTGADRKSRLTNAGYNYNTVQAIVNDILKATPKAPVRKSNTEIAKEVIAGKWGNGVDRRKRLAGAGYNYNAVQKEVNRLL